MHRSADRRPRPWAAWSVLPALTLAALGVLAAPRIGSADSAPVGAPDNEGTYLGQWPPLGPGWAAPVDQPPLAERCGVDVGLLLDRSGSIERAGQAPTVRAAALAAVRALAGTPSRVGLWTFGDGAAAGPGDPAHPAVSLGPVGGADGPGQVAALEAAVAAIPFNPFAATNWEAGLRAVAAAPDRPDLLMVVTDGRPTVHLGDGSSGSTTDVEDVDAAIRAANDLKAGGTRLFAVGVGPDVDPSTLALVTEPVPWLGGDLGDAGYTTTTFDQLEPTLAALARRLCGGTVTVHKVLRLPDGTEIDGAGWAFRAHQPGTPGAAQAAITDGAGLAAFELANVADVRLAVTEEARPGHRLVATEIACTRAGGPPPRTWPRDGGVEVEVGPTDVVTCRFPNQVEQVDLVVTKTDHDRSVPVGDDLTYELSVTNTGNVAATGVELVETVPADATLDPGPVGNDAWRCDGEPGQGGRFAAGTTCRFTVGELGPGEASGPVPFVVRAEAVPADGATLVNVASAHDDGSHGPDADPADNAAEERTPVVEPPVPTTTEAPTTTVVAPAAPPATDPSPDEPAEVMGTHQAAPAGSLPRTGSSTLPLAAAGLAFVVGGYLVTTSVPSGRTARNSGRDLLRRRRADHR